MAKSITKKHWLTKQLSDPQIYLASIEKYVNKLYKRSVYNLEDELGGTEINWLSIKKKELSKIIASLFTTQELNFAVLTHKILYTKDKARSIYIGKTLENIVDSAIVNVLLSKLKEYGVPGVESYLPGSSPLKTIQSVAKFLKKTPGDIVLLRTDLANYSDTIPIDNISKLWQLLDNFIVWLDPQNPIEEYTYSLIKSRIIASYIDEGVIKQRDVGVLTGRPITSLVSVLYLHDLDTLMSKLIGLYFRYGDDILWMTNNINDFEQGNTIIGNKIDELKLSRNLAKDLYATLTTSGTNYTGIDKFKGITHLEYLGLAISRNGSIRLTLKSIQKLKKEIDSRIKNINNNLVDIKDMSQKIKTVVLALNQFLHSSFVLKRSFSAKYIINDRSLLKELDFFIATRIVMISTNTYKLHIFKQYSYKWLRHECKLISLCNIVNYQE